MSSALRASGGTYGSTVITPEFMVGCWYAASGITEIILTQHPVVGSEVIISPAHACMHKYSKYTVLSRKTTHFLQGEHYNLALYVIAYNDSKSFSAFLNSLY